MSSSASLINTPLERSSQRRRGEKAVLAISRGRESALTLQSRQKLLAVNLSRLRRVVTIVLHEFLDISKYELGIYLVTEAEISRLNQDFLKHKGATDVITFDYNEQAGSRSRRLDRLSRPLRKRSAFASLHGEIFICTAEAVAQARRFRTTWQRELVRYIIHGILHLQGFDDSRPGRRRKMKREEDRLLRRTSICLE